MNLQLENSYARCRQIARTTGTNFYYSILLLRREQRRAMCALYAFLRLTDDLGDSPTAGPPQDALATRIGSLERWRTSLDRALQEQFDHPIFPALADTVARFAIPADHLHTVIDGVAMDLEGVQYETFAELETYCHRVAGVVGLACLHIWGYDDARALQLARPCGLAFQLTNILRDIGEDAERGRIYLPGEDLRRFGYEEDELKRHVRDGRLSRLMKFEIARAESCYAESAALVDCLHGGGRAMFGAMFETYRMLLREIDRRDGDVFGERVRLSPWRKLRIAAGWLLTPAAVRPLRTAART